MLNSYKPYAHTFMWLCDMAKRRTTIIVDDQLWKRFLSYVVGKHASAKKASVEVEAAIKEYLDHHEHK